MKSKSDLKNALYVAVKGGRIEIVKLLLEFIKPREIHLVDAITSGYRYDEMVKILVAAGAKFQLDILTMVASWEFEIVKCLIDAGIDFKVNGGEPLRIALERALSYKNFKNVEYLAKHGAKTSASELYRQSINSDSEIYQCLISNNAVEEDILTIRYELI